MKDDESALSAAYGDYLKLRDKLARPDFVIIYNFGMRKLTAMEAEHLCELIEERRIDRSIVFTVQRPLKHWAEVIADATRDRLE